MEHHFFMPDTVDLHNEPEQLERQEGVSAYKVTKIDKFAFTALVTSKGASEESANVSLKDCTCDDFKMRGKPCRHMYAFASKQIELDDGTKIKFFARKNERSETLMADFSKGYAAGWSFVVRPCNYESLDIKWMPKTVKKETFSQLTQGDVYNFSEGSVFYDTPIAYEVPWGIALQSIYCSLQITKTISSYTIPFVYVNESGILERTDKPVYGEVYFDVFRPDSAKKKEQRVARFSCKQNEFLKLLQTGIFLDSDGLSHNLLEGKVDA